MATLSIDRKTVLFITSPLVGRVVPIKVNKLLMHFLRCLNMSKKLFTLSCKGKN